MTRKEEIVTQAVKEKSQLHQPLEWGAGFISGANWADKTMLDRACEWLKKNIDLYAYETSNTHYPEIKLTKCFETAFRQAMEGGAE